MNWEEILAWALVVGVVGCSVIGLCRVMSEWDQKQYEAGQRAKNDEGHWLSPANECHGLMSQPGDRWAYLSPVVPRQDEAGKGEA